MGVGDGKVFPARVTYLSLGCGAFVLVVDAFLYTFEYIVGKVWRGVARCGCFTLVTTYLYFNLTLP